MNVSARALVAGRSLVVSRNGPGWWEGHCVESESLDGAGVFVVGRRRAEVLELLTGLVAGLRALEGERAEVSVGVAAGGGAGS